MVYKNVNKSSCCGNDGGDGGGGGASFFVFLSLDLYNKSMPYLA